MRIPLIAVLLVSGLPFAANAKPVVFKENEDLAGIAQSYFARSGYGVWRGEFPDRMMRYHDVIVPENGKFTKAELVPAE